jgi:hypothetical protein
VKDKDVVIRYAAHFRHDQININDGWANQYPTSSGEDGGRRGFSSNQEILKIWPPPGCNDGPCRASLNSLRAVEYWLASLVILLGCFGDAGGIYRIKSSRMVCDAKAEKAVSCRYPDKKERLSSFYRAAYGRLQQG